MKALTDYGKILRHYRLDNQLLLADMANALDLSPAYLSSIESGTRSIPVDLTEKVCAVYGFDEKMKTALLKAEANSNKSLTINLEDASEEAVDTLVMFARDFKNYSVEEIRALYKELKRRDNA